MMFYNTVHPEKPGGLWLRTLHNGYYHTNQNNQGNSTQNNGTVKDVIRGRATYQSVFSIALLVAFAIGACGVCRCFDSCAVRKRSHCVVFARLEAVKPVAILGAAQATGNDAFVLTSDKLSLIRPIIAR